MSLSFKNWSYAKLLSFYVCQPLPLVIGKFERTRENWEYKNWAFMYITHSWAKFKIILVRKPGRKFYYFTAKFQGSGFSFPSLNQNIKVMVFPSNFWFQNFKVNCGYSFQVLKKLPWFDNFLEWFWIFLRNVITSKIKWE